MSEASAKVDLAQLRAEDATARAAALDLARSFIVQAPAGSGKTELLIQRYLALLAHVDAPEEIVAITFTRKATAEMRVRVLEALGHADGATPPAEPHRRVTWDLARKARARDTQAQWNVLENPNRLRVQTIDSLCHWLTLQLPVLSGFGAQPETVEDARELYAEAAQRTLAGLDGGNEWSPYVARILRHLDNHVERAQELIAHMLGVRDQWMRTVMDPRGRSRAALEAALSNATCDALARLAALVPPGARGEIAGLAHYAAKNLEAAGTDSPILACHGLTALPGAAPGNLDSWRAIAELLLTRTGEVRRQVDVRTGFPPGKTKAGKEAAAAMKSRFDALAGALAPYRTFIEQLHLARILPPAAYSDTQWEVVEALAGLLPVAVAQLEVLFKERGQVDFTAVAQAAARALGEADAPTELALALDYRIRHILVDEFQDTSWSQHDLLKGLTAGWHEGDGHTLFVVGDPMQSIYRFRKAEVGLYLRAWHEGIGGVALTPLRLAVNFRSAGAVVDWLNRAFQVVLPDAEDLASGAVPFAPLVAAESAAAGVAPEFHPLLTPDRETEARLVVDLVRARRAENDAQAIAILVRARAHLAGIAPALIAARIRFQAIEIEQLTHRPVVRDLLALTRALVHAGDRVAWLAVLRAPWCGLTLADLEALAGHDHAAAVWTLMNDTGCVARVSEDGKARLARTRTALGAGLARRRREPLRRWIEGAWLALGGPACAENETDLQDAHAFFSLVAGLEEGGDLPDLERLAARVEELYAAPDADREASRLQLMTIHKAKGLEFDTVIVPGLGHPPRRGETKLLLWTERPRLIPPPAAGEEAGVRGEADLLLAPVRDATERQSAIYDYLNDLEGAKDRHEGARLLYVAATRARSRLHLIGQVDGGAKNLKPKARTLLEHLWPAVEAQFVAAVRAQEEPPAATATAAALPPPFIRRFPAGWQAPAPPPGVAWKPRATLQYEGRSPHDEIEFSWASETTKHAGTVMHRFLQLIAADGLEKWSAERVGGMRDVIARDLRCLGVPDSEMAGAVERVTQALQAGVRGERGRWVLGVRPEAQTELRLTGDIDGEIVSVAMDRTFVDESGTRWIVDYKTGAHEGGELEAFLDRERERYRPQLERYAQLMRALDSRPIRLGLYFPLLDGWREWEYGAADERR